MCLVYPILSVSLDCPYLIALHYSLTFICPVSCVPYFVSFSRLSISDCHSLFSNVYLSVSLDCTYLIAFHLSLTFICPVSYVPYFVSFSRLSISDCPSLFSKVYLSCVLCTLFCQFLWIVHMIALHYSLTFICPVSCVPYFVSFSGLSI
jgi:hypothetical protein